MSQTTKATKHFIAQALELMLHLLQCHGRRLTGQPSNLSAQLLDDGVSGLQQRVFGLDVVTQQHVRGLQLLQLSQRRAALLLGIVQLQLQRPHVAERRRVSLLIKCYTFSQRNGHCTHLQAHTQVRHEGLQGVQRKRRECRVERGEAAGNRIGH